MLKQRKPLQRKTPLRPGTKGLKRTGFRPKHGGSTWGTKRSADPEDAYIIDGDERPVVQDDDRHAARAARQLASFRETRAMVAKVGLVALVSTDAPSCAPIEKDNPIRHEGYRRLVASMPCMWCGRQGRSNHAHLNGLSNGKGKGMKVDDRLATSLCVDDLGTGGCHTAFDQYALIDGGRDAHAELGRRMAQATRIAIWLAGKWPKNLPLWPEDLPLLQELQAAGRGPQTPLL